MSDKITIFLGENSEFFIDLNMVYSAYFDISNLTMTLYFGNFKKEIEYETYDLYVEHKQMIEEEFVE